MRRETLKAIEVARDQLINNLHQERKGSKMQTLGASNPHNNSPFSAYPKSISTSCEFFHKDFLYQHSEPNNFCSIYFNTISAPKIPLGCWQNQMGAVFCCHYHHHQIVRDKEKMRGLAGNTLHLFCFLHLYFL